MAAGLDAVGPTLRANLLSTGTTHGARIPIAPNSVLHGVVTVSARGMAIYEELFERAVSLGHIVALALFNALTLEKSEREATTDPLTGLADRRGFDFEVVRLRGGRPFAVLALDVDDLKQVNGNLGHATGDARLVATAQVMTRVMRWGDLVARVGDDEFAAFLVHASEEGARQTAQRILAALKLTQIDGVNPAVSLGVACGSLTSDLAEVLQEADTAMCIAKRQGGNSYVLAEPCFATKVAGRLAAGLLDP